MVKKIAKYIVVLLVPTYRYFFDRDSEGCHWTHGELLMCNTYWLVLFMLCDPSDIQKVSPICCSASKVNSVTQIKAYMEFSLASLQHIHWNPYGDVIMGTIVSNQQTRDCFLNHLFRHRSKKTSKLRVTGLCVGNSPGTGEFPAQMANNAENVSIWWRHHARSMSWIDQAQNSQKRHNISHLLVNY